MVAACNASMTKVLLYQLIIEALRSSNHNPWKGNSMRIEVSIFKGIKVEVHVDEDSVLAMESHELNIRGFKTAEKNGDTESMDSILPSYHDEKDDARKAARAFFTQCMNTRDKRERIALKRLAMKGLKSL